MIEPVVPFPYVGEPFEETLSFTGLTALVEQARLFSSWPQLLGKNRWKLWEFTGF